MRMKITTSLLKVEATSADWHGVTVAQSINLGKLSKPLRNKLYRAALNGYGITKSGLERAVFFYLSRAFNTPSSYISNSTMAMFMTIAKGADLDRQKTEVIAALAMFMPDFGKGDRGWRHQFSIETSTCRAMNGKNTAYENRWISWQISACCPPSLLTYGHNMFRIHGPSIPIERLHTVADCMGAKETRATYAARFDAMAEAIDRGDTVSMSYADITTCDQE